MADSDTQTEEVEEKKEALRQSALVKQAEDRDRDHNIYQRVHAVMLDLRSIEKTRTHEIWKDGKKRGEFPYISHDDVTAHIRPALLRHGIMVIPTVTKCENNGNRTELEAEVSFVNVDKNDDRITIRVPGYGADTQDKGPGKAFSYAVKYAYLKLFMLNSGDDIEEHDIEHVRADNGDELAQAELEVKLTKEQLAENYKIALENCQTKEAFEELKKNNKKHLKSWPAVTKAFFVNLERETENRLS